MERQRQRITSNGVSVYSYRQPHVHSFCIGLYARAGALYEKSGEAGVTHFLEHVLFRNLGGMPQKELYERLEAMGAYFNACTYKEFVQFYITAPPACFGECALILTRLLAPLSVTKADVGVERRRIQSEIREEDYRRSLEYLSAGEIWKGTPLANPIMGTITGIRGIGLDKLSEAKNGIFAAGNLCFYVTGRFTDEDVEGLCQSVEAYALPRSGLQGGAVPVPADFMKRGAAVRIVNSSELPSLCFSFDTAYSRYTMGEIHLIYDLLFKGCLSRFQTLLSERKGLIYSFDSVLDQYGAVGTVYVEYSVSLSRLNDAVRLTSGIFRSMREAIDDTDLSFHLPRYGDNYDILLDEPERLNWDMAFDNFILGRGFQSIGDVKRQFREVRPERLMEVASEIFTPDNLVLVIKAPRRKCREEKIREMLAEL